MNRSVRTTIILLALAFFSSPASHAMVRDKVAGREIFDNGRLVISINAGKSGVLALAYRLGGKTIPAAQISINTGQADAPLAAVKSYNVKPQKDGTLLLAVDYGNLRTLNLLLEDNSEYIKITKTKAVKNINIGFTSDALIIPDRICTEDIALYPSTSPVRTRITSDSHLALNLLTGTDAILTCLWDSPDAAIYVEKDKDSEHFKAWQHTASEKATLWIGINAAKGIWHKVIQKLNYINPVQLNWQAPFPARWYVTMKKAEGFFPEENGLTNTWVFISKENQKPKYIEMGMAFTNVDSWKAWSADYGGFIYPCSFTPEGATLQFPQILAYKNHSYDATFSPVIYPLKNSNSKLSRHYELPMTAAKERLPADIYSSLTSTRSPDDHYPATCGVTEQIEKVFYREREKEEKDLIKKRLDQMNHFVFNVRKRIERYMKWSRDLDGYFLNIAKANPAIESVVTEFREILSRMQWNYAEKADRMKTPEYTKTLTAKVVALIDAAIDGEAKESACKKLGRAIRTIGGSQDSTLSMMRFTAKCLRQKAALRIAKGASSEELSMLMEVRRQTAFIMRLRQGIEGK